jgi:hypothetical protein
MLVDMARESKTAGVARALLECNSPLSPASVLSLVGSLGDIGFPADYKFALLTTHEGARETAEFAETVGMNRSWRIRSFTDRGLALSWLDS